MTSRLENLPPELLLSTAEYIPRPSDLKALCLASKALRACALPSLYNKVSLDSSQGWDPATTNGLLKIGHIGLQYIRKLHIGAIGGQTSCDAELHFLRLLLTIIPRNALKYIDCSSLRLDESTIYLILAQQTKLESIALGPVKCNFAHLLQPNTLSWNGLKELNIPETIGVNDLEAYQQIIEKASRLSILKMRCSTQLTAKSSKSTYDDKTLVNGKLLSHVKPAVTKMRLDRLDLQCINIRHDTATLFDLSHLRSLSLWGCSDPTFLLRAMTAQFTKNQGRCALREFSFHTMSKFRYRPVEALLESFKGLDVLRLSCHDNKHGGRLDFSCLDGHEDTLETLLVGTCHIDEQNEELMLDLDYTMFASFPKLRKLAVPMPPITIPCATGEPLLDYTKAFEILMTVPKLKVLTILNWPRVVGGTFADDDEGDDKINSLNKKAFMHDLDDFVNTNICKLIWGPTFVRYADVDPYGEVPPTYDGTGVQVDLDPVCYVPGKHTDLFGNTHTSASRTTLKSARYIEPEVVDEGVWPMRI